MIKIIALDIYGTILATDDSENLLKPRKSLEKLFGKCNDEGIKLVTSSDADLINLKTDLQESGVDLGRFDRFYELKQNPKDFSQIIKDYGIKPEELLVIGDSDKDIKGAQKIGARYFRVPEYIDRNNGDDFDLSDIKF